jgi:bile acid:Na+ symporter, BASS family
MQAFLSQVLNLAILLFLVSTMLASGLSLTLAQILGPFRNVRLALSAAVMSFVVSPLIAVGIARLFGLEEPLRIGLVLFAMAAGADIGPKLVTNAKGNAGFSVGLLVLSLCVTSFYIPMMLSLLLPEVHIDKGHLLIKLSLMIAVPVSLGLFIKARFAQLADRLVHSVHQLATVCMYALVGLILMLNYSAIIRLLGSGALIAGLIFIIVSFMVGYWLGGADRGTRVTMGFMHGARNASVALLIAAQAFGDQSKVLVMITVVALIMLFLLLPLSLFMGRAGRPSAGEV